MIRALKSPRLGAVFVALVIASPAAAEVGTRTLAVAPISVLGRDAAMESRFDALLHDELSKIGVTEASPETTAKAWSELTDPQLDDDLMLGRFARGAGAARALAILFVSRPESWAVTARIVRNDGVPERMLADLEFPRPASGDLEAAARKAIASTLEELKLESVELYPLVSPVPAPAVSVPPSTVAPAPAPPIGAYALIAGGVAGIAAGAWLAVGASRTWTEVNAVGGGEYPEDFEKSRIRELKSTADLQSALSIAAFVIGAGATGGGIYLLAAAPRSGAPRVALRFDGRGVALTGSFP